MARSHGQLLASIWSDPDWLALTGGAQRVYMLLLSQPKLTLVGLLDYLPSRWARLAADTTPDTVEEDIDELEASRFVIVDRNTDELLVRTLVRHDITSLAKGTGSSKLIKGLWRAWQGIESRQLRHIAAHEIPDSLWDSNRVEPPAEAAQMRRSPPIELPIDSSIEPSIEPKRARNSPLSTLHYAEADLQQPRNSRGDPPNEAAAVDNSDRLSDDERQQRLGDAIELLVARELERNPSRQNPRRHASAVRRGKHRDYRQIGHQALADDPTLTPLQLADLLEPPSQPTTNGHRVEPERATPDGKPFMPGIGPMPGLPSDLPERAEAHPDKVASYLAAGRAQLRQPHRPDPGDQP